MPRYGSVPDDVPWIAAPRPRRAALRPRVLLVAQDTMLGFALVGVLEGRFDVELARDATRAMQVLATSPVDVVLADEDLPGGRRGVELLAEIRQRHPRVHRVIMSADVDALPRRDGLWRHALQKPFELEELLEILGEPAVESVAGPA